MTKRIASTCSLLIALFLPWLVASCSGLEDEVDRDGDEPQTGSLSQETTCSPVVTRFPVNARHNTGFDSSCASAYCNLYCPPQAQTYSNSDYHGGIDIFADPGAPVVAAQAGTINWSFSDPTGGNVVYLRDACGWNHYYAHLATIAPSLSLGQFVPVGTPIGTVGNTGNAAGTQHHLHYGAYDESWTPTNPFSQLNAAEGSSCTSSALPNLQPTTITYTPSTISPGNLVTFDSGVRNVGPVGTGNFNIKWFIDGVQVGYGGHTGVPANSTVLNGNSSFSWTAVTGTHTIGFNVDVDNSVSESSETDNNTSISVGVGTVIVDDTSPGFVKYGPTGYWQQGAVGYSSHMWYTYVNGTIQSNYARWTPPLPSSGNFAVYVFIPSNYATSQQAKYRIYHQGVSNYATVNQNNYYDQWIYIGTFGFSANGTEYVELGDATGEAASTYRMLGFDAVKFVKQ